MADTAFTPNVYRFRAGRQDQPYDEIRVMNPSRGLNNQVADNMANDKDASDGVNWEYAEGGVVRKRPGFREVATGFTSAPRGLGSYYTENFRKLITVHGNALSEVNIDNGAITSLSSTVTFTPNQEVTFTVCKGKAYIWNGAEGGTEYDGTTVARPGTMPRGEFGIYYQGKQIASGVSGHPNRIYISGTDPGDFTNSTALSGTDVPDLTTSAGVPGATVFAGSDANALDVRKDDGDRVTGLGIFQDILIIFKERSIFQLEFNESGTPVVKMITNTYGCVSHRSIENVENDLYFLSRGGVYVLGNEPNFFAAIRTNELSSRIKPLMEQIEPTAFKKCNAVYYDNRYFLALPLNSASITNVIPYDRRFYAWSMWDTITPNYMSIFIDANQRAHFLYADDKSKRVCEIMFGSYSDAGQPINFRFRTRAFDAGKIDREKYWKELRPVFRQISGTVRLKYFTPNEEISLPLEINNTVEGGIGYDMYGDEIWGMSQTDALTDTDLGINVASTTSTAANLSTAQTTNIVPQLPIELDARTFKVEFINDALNESVVILGWIILFHDKDPMRSDGQYVYR